METREVSEQLAEKAFKAGAGAIKARLYENAFFYAREALAWTVSADCLDSVDDTEICDQAKGYYEQAAKCYQHVAKQVGWLPLRETTEEERDTAVNAANASEEQGWRWIETAQETQTLYEEANEKAKESSK